MQVRYDSATGQYRDERGRFVSRARILALIDEEVGRMSVRLRGHARNFVAGNITLDEFLLRMAQDIKLSHVRMTGLAAGGVAALTVTLLAGVSALLGTQYKHLIKFGTAIATGIDPRRVVRRAGYYSRAVKVAYFKAEKIVRQIEKFNEAKRDLDPQAQHCKSCLGHSTNGEWRPISEVVVPGTQCECRFNCRCRISYRRRL